MNHEKLWMTVAVPTVVWGAGWTAWLLLEYVTYKIDVGDMGGAVVIGWGPAAVAYGVRRWLRWARE